ncbi:hypothetical protein LCGC14_2682490, partial [marine sediment metagenome]
GRYVSSDPMGLFGDLNTYLYARANPLRYVDPFGLWPAVGEDCVVVVTDTRNMSNIDFHFGPINSYTIYIVLGKPRGTGSWLKFFSDVDIKSITYYSQEVSKTTSTWTEQDYKVVCTDECGNETENQSGSPEISNENTTTSGYTDRWFGSSDDKLPPLPL